MKEFIEWLEGLSRKDTKVRAVLRRSLSFDPGRYAPAYPYVEPFTKDEDISWRREMLYLVAGLWAAHWREGRTSAGTHREGVRCLSGGKRIHEYRAPFHHPAGCRY